jgi:hypothetical protein
MAIMKKSVCLGLFTKVLVFFCFSSPLLCCWDQKHPGYRDNSRRDCGRDVALLSSYRAEGTGIILLQQSRRTLLGMVPTSGHDDDDCWESG